MLMVLSPAKTLDYESPLTTEAHSLPDFIPRSAELITTLRELSPDKLGTLMKISDQLAHLNVDRYASWSKKFNFKNSRQALLAFNGDVYEGLDAPTLNEKQLSWAQDHLRILSGLYGVLRPLDLMQPYRLEMGTRLQNAHGKDLYAFWGDEVTDSKSGSERSDGSIPSRGTIFSASVQLQCSFFSENKTLKTSFQSLRFSLLPFLCLPQH